MDNVPNIPFPLWVVAETGRYEASGLPAGLALAEEEGRPFPLLPLFTTERYAEDYISDLDAEGECTAVRVESPVSFYEWLAGMAEQRVNRVRFNPTDDPDVPELEVDLGRFFAGLARAGRP